MDEHSFTLAVAPPFRLDLTVWALRRRPENRTDRWDGQFYRRALPLGPQGGLIGLAVRQGQSGHAGQPELQVSLTGAGAGQARLGAQLALRRMLGLEVDLSDFYRLAEGDAMLGPLARQFRGFRPPRFPSVFETLANAISCQQITLSLGITLLNRLIAAHGQVHPAAAAGESGPDALNAFPTPEDLAEAPPETLRPLGFSGQKARYLTELAGAVAAGELDLETLAALDNAEAAARLRQLRGVGRWTAEYALLRGLGRLDTFPGDDAGARNGLQRWLGLTEKLDYDGVQRIVGRWQPYAGLVYFHLLLASLDKRGVIGEMAPVAGD